MKIKNSLSIILSFIYSCFCSQQEYREFHTNDSTEYIYNSDTTIIVSRNKLYFNSSAGISLAQDFTSPDTANYIVDFDIISDNVWYIIYGSRFWGRPSTLYKSMDKGLSWLSDTTIFNATQIAFDSGHIAEKDCLYQLQRISQDTILVFASYYSSGIFYSVDAGLNWNLWFANTPANYRGLFECGENYYLWGIAGDGFQGSMFAFNKNLLLSSNSNGIWTQGTGGGYHPSCYGGGNISCIYASNSITGYDQFLFFENYLQNNCGGIANNTSEQIQEDFMIISPDPFNAGTYTISWMDDFKPKMYSLYTNSGQLLLKDKIINESSMRIDLTKYSNGFFILVIENETIRINKKLIY